MKTVAVMELKGFTRIADSLAMKMEYIGLTPERVRASIVEILSTSIKKTNDIQRCDRWFYVGGDTWFFVFDDLNEGVHFSSILLGTLFNAVTNKGLFYIKPSIAINVGNPKIQNGRFLDGDSILAYRVADKGMPYRLALVNNAVIQSVQYDWIKFSEKEEKIEDREIGDYTIKYINWKDLTAKHKLDVIMPDFDLPSLLLDGEVLFSESTQDAIYNLINQQNNSSNVVAFGGAVDIRQQMYMGYVKSLIAQAMQQNNFHISIMNYLPMERPELCYIWLETCMAFSELLKDKSICKLFVLPKESIRPISYHVFDNETVFLGLRSYSIQRGISTMSSSIMLRNKEIASRFENEFLESWRGIDTLDSKCYSNLRAKFSNINQKTVGAARDLINELLQYAESLK